MAGQKTSQHTNPILVFVQNETFTTVGGVAFEVMNATDGTSQGRSGSPIGVTDFGKLEFAQSESRLCAAIRF